MVTLLQLDYTYHTYGSNQWNFLRHVDIISLPCEDSFNWVANCVFVEVTH